jgi:hypothetical protein
MPECTHTIYCKVLLMDRYKPPNCADLHVMLIIYTIHCYCLLIYFRNIWHKWNLKQCIMHKIGCMLAITGTTYCQWIEQYNLYLIYIYCANQTHYSQNQLYFVACRPYNRHSLPRGVGWGNHMHCSTRGTVLSGGTRIYQQGKIASLLSFQTVIVVCVCVCLWVLWDTL